MTTAPSSNCVPPLKIVPMTTPPEMTTWTPPLLIVAPIALP
jgi:hypothetical protein